MNARFRVWPFEWVADVQWKGAKVLIEYGYRARLVNGKMRLERGWSTHASMGGVVVERSQGGEQRQAQPISSHNTMRENEHPALELLESHVTQEKSGFSSGEEVVTSKILPTLPF